MLKHRQYTYFYIFSRATLNETFMAKYDGVLPRTLKIRNLQRDDEHPHPFHIRSRPPPRCSIENAGNPHPFIIQPRHPTLTSVSGHFSLPDHSTKDIEFIPLQLIISDKDSIRKAREGFLYLKARHLNPIGWTDEMKFNLLTYIFM